MCKMVKLEGYTIRLCLKKFFTYFIVIYSLFSGFLPTEVYKVASI